MKLRAIIFACLLACTLGPWLLPTADETTTPTNNASTYNSIVDLTPDVTLPDSATASRHTLNLTSLASQNVSQIKSLHLQLGTFHKTLQVQTAELSQSSTGCGWSTPQSNFALADLAQIELLQKNPACKFDGSTEFIFSVIADGPLAAFSWPQWTEISGNPKFQAKSPSGAIMPIMFRYARTQKHLTSPDFTGAPAASKFRAGLLAYMWGADSTSDLIVFFSILLTGCLLVALGGSLIPDRHFHAPTALIAGFLLIYCVASPPFQAPDEADHYRSFCNLTGRTTEAARGLELANRGHYERLLCLAEEKFSRSDIGHSLTGTWPTHSEPPDALSRSAIAATLWPVYSSLFPTPAHANHLHLGLRLLNALYFFGALLIARLALRSENLALKMSNAPVLAILSLPTLWHFAVHNSNHGFIIASYAVTTLFAAPLIFGEALSKKTLLTGGAVLATGALAGRAGFLYAIIFASFWGLRWIGMGLQSKTTVNWRLEIAAFLSWYAPTAVLLAAFYRSPYVKSIAQQATGLVSKKSLLASCAILAFILIFSRIARPSRTAVTRWLAILAKWFRVRENAFTKTLSLGLVCAILFLLIPHNLSPGPVPDIELPLPNPGPVKYAVIVIKKFFATLSLGRNDFLLHETAWGGFGCPDRVLSGWMVQIPKVFFATLILLGLLKLVRRREWDSTFKTILYLISCVIWLAGLAAGLGISAENIQGRYTVGVFLFFLTAAYLNATSKNQIRWGFVLALTIQVLILAALSARYFA